MMYKSTDLSVKDKIILTSCMFTGLTGVYFLNKYLNKQIKQMYASNRREIVTEVIQQLEMTQQEGEIQKILNNMPKRLIFTI
jgi:hypothetical protein